MSTEKNLYFTGKLTIVGKTVVKQKKKKKDVGTIDLKVIHNADVRRKANV